jgi:hypothetical protein
MARQLGDNYKNTAINCVSRGKLHQPGKNASDTCTEDVVCDNGAIPN